MNRVTKNPCTKQDYQEEHPRQLDTELDLQGQEGPVRGPRTIKVGMPQSENCKYGVSGKPTGGCGGKQDGRQAGTNRTEAGDTGYEELRVFFRGQHNDAEVF